MGYQCIVFCTLGACHRQFGGDLQTFRALSRQRLFQSDNLLGHGSAISIHAM
jgi:hypothetical protein